MSSSTINKYIDIDSTYRDRNLYPLQTDFVIPVNFQAKAHSVFNASDPVFLEYPYEINKTATPIAVPTNAFTLDATFLSIDNVYSNSYFENNSLALTPSWHLITSYVGSTRIATLANNTTVLAGSLVSIRKRLPDVRDALVAGSTITTINLGGIASQTTNYAGYIIRFVTIGGVASTEYRIIKSYNGSTRVATLQLPLSVAPIAGDIYELLPYNYDNFNTLLYSGTYVLTQPVCYAIELLYLTIPNTLVLNGNRGNLDSYPYFYVKLYNENKNISNHILYSNNPNTEFATFKIPMTLTLSREKFFTLRDSKCVQVMKFQPDQSIRFIVTLPNGEPIQFQTPDYLSPNEPNPYLQISASFSIRRIEN